MVYSRGKLTNELCPCYYKTVRKSNPNFTILNFSWVFRSQVREKSAGFSVTRCIIYKTGFSSVHTVKKSCLFVRGTRPTVWGKIYRQLAIIGCIIETENERNRIREPILASDLFDLRERLSKLPILFKYDFLVDILLGFFYFIRINLPFPTR